MRHLFILFILFVFAFAAPSSAQTVDEEAVVFAALKNLSRQHDEDFPEPAILERRQMDRDSAIFPLKAEYFYGDLERMPNLAALTTQLNEFQLQAGNWPDEIVRPANNKMDSNEITKRIRLSQSISVQAAPHYRFFVYSKFTPEKDRIDGLVVVNATTLETARYPMAFICGF